MTELDREGRDELHYAARDNNVELARERLAAGVDVNLADHRSNYTPLHFAVDNGAVDVAAVLLDAGADIDARGKRELTPLNLAVERWKQSPAGVMITLLVNRGADKTARDATGFTPAEKAQGQRKFPAELSEILQP
ncbi:ankyrin repeat domain-containing protein [Saccharopolyspora spinosa]|uniref:ankyrin repeat domain-containing protein n=1 Tax=Saccharopolyspora spinosa TaxID=60894 RepID=UPI000237B0F3|nr:ankyrin repeat domain-containing protein [Saccharopolyspora spinosa]